ncbi:MAG: type II toxin-antitoxin system VapC family toxin [Gammaproteobacteria bacterium]|nr:type II toxin-antitoxin system VapC family toxin [Gammaproteobacteria bacterium]
MSAPTSWILDTNILSEMMRPIPEARVASFLYVFTPDGISLDASTV